MPVITGLIAIAFSVRRALWWSTRTSGKPCTCTGTLSVLVARGRAQVGVAAATADWPKRIRDMRYADQEDRGTAD